MTAWSKEAEEFADLVLKPIEPRADTQRNDAVRRCGVKCIKCGGDEDLMDRGMAPGMTYCRPCRARMAKDASTFIAQPDMQPGRER